MVLEVEIGLPFEDNNIAVFFSDLPLCLLLFYLLQHLRFYFLLFAETYPSLFCLRLLNFRVEISGSEHGSER